MSFTLRAPVAKLSAKANVAESVNVRPAQRVAAKAPVAASAQLGRREMFSFIATGAALVATKANAIEIIDFKDANSKGFQEIYEARELENGTYNEKGGVPQRFALKRLSGDETKGRITESLDRLSTKIQPSIDVEAYPLAQNELRRQLGYLRFDIRTLAADDKSIAGPGKDLVLAVEDLDLALRFKNQDKANALYQKVLIKADALSSAL
ncbi:hypothetical protein CYMTET_48803 [Cymbomonas tetramitiformis]|uniref:Uncharacterized protein n=1 Tax=Cymbomonas tetramitiformis TaxID=36881 RepID=A0AAE0BT43_9CHLO|nr:hypothetical protein CYMTET_48803 [Cymbomonas tetramitiformis]